jgi:hypothetical protein
MVGRATAMAGHVVNVQIPPWQPNLFVQATKRAALLRVGSAVEVLISDAAW